MKKIILFINLSILAITSPAQLPLIPQPVSVRLNEGVFKLKETTLIVVTYPAKNSDAELFNDHLEKVYGFRLQIVSKVKDVGNTIMLIEDINGSIPMDGYNLSISTEQITIRGYGSGVFYGFQTLKQLLPLNNKQGINIPCGEISDNPRYNWRGMHLDVSRHFFPKEFIKKYIDYLAMYKMNTFHWHLTDDQGWRIEIKKYPLLTSIGAWRKETIIGHQRDSNKEFDNTKHGGFYTQDDIREIVKYATDRHITIIPEIEMPGHAVAALSAYPQYSCTGGPFEVEKEWGVFNDVFCAGNDSTFTFLEDILSEVIDLFPSTYIHIGGDECPKNRWVKCPKCQKRIKTEKLQDEHELQSYFIKRIEKFVNSKGRKIIGWDEILEGGLAPNAAVMSWRGINGGIAAAKEKHPVVMSPGSHCYFDHYQAKPKKEPLAIGGYTPIQKVYSYEPTPVSLSIEEQEYIMGAQANVWTEYITTEKQVEYMAMPRMAALSEVLWSQKENRNWKDFKKRLPKHLDLLDQLGVNYCDKIKEPINLKKKNRG